MNNQNIIVDYSSFYLNEEEIRRLNYLQEGISRWNIQRDEYFSELHNLKFIVVNRETRMRKEQCKSGLRATNEWIDEAIEEIEEIEKKARKEEERWEYLEMVELSFK